MKKWNGCSSESKKCAFCGKVTSNYVVYEVKGIEIQINIHYECEEDLSITAKKCFRELKKSIRNKKC